MTTIHLGIEELIARQREESMQRTVRQARHLTEFWRRVRRTQPTRPSAQTRAWAGELVELSVSRARWAMI